MRFNAQRNGIDANDDQNDFKALLARTEKQAATSTDTHDMNLDHLTRESSSPVADKKDKGPSYGGAYSKRMVSPFFERLSAYISMLCYFYPCFCGSIVFMVIGLILYGLGTLIFNPRVEYGLMKHDHSFLDSEYNMKAGDIDHWCLRGDNDSCRCEDPLVPTPRAERKSWTLAYKANRKTVKMLKDVDLDIVLLGESVVEEMDGRWMGQARTPLSQLSTQFKQRFTKKEGGKLNGFALGIAGDTAPNVLWRLMHGEMIDEVNPKIWWLSLGMNDLARMQCSEEVVVMGILRIVEEILENKPGAHVVINSLFPMSMVRGGLYPMLNDFQDSLRTPHSSRTRASSTDPILQVPKNPGVTAGRGSDQNNRFLKRKNEGPEKPRTEEEAADAEERAREKMMTKKKVSSLFKSSTWKEKRKEKAANPVLKETHAIRKHVADVQLPIWTSVRVVNNQLRQFAKNNNERVSFFDATPLFTAPSSGTSRGVTLLTDYISIRGHPTPKGFQVWEDAIVERATSIIDELRKTNPDLFVSDADSEQFDLVYALEHGYQLLNDDDYSDDGLYGLSDDFTN